MNPPNNHPDDNNMVYLTCSIAEEFVPVTSRTVDVKTVELVLETFPPFLQWKKIAEKNILANPADRMEVHAIDIQSVDFFGREKIGFVKMNVDCSKNGVKLPGICFLRGSSVGVLVCLHVIDGSSESRGKNRNRYALLVEQTRVPIGCEPLLELPAGMLDDNGDFLSQAAAELREECDIHIHADDLIDLTQVTPDEGIVLSGGGCDETMKLFYIEKSITKSELKATEGKLSGLRYHGELITLKVVRFNDLWKATKDAKVLCALHLLEKLQKYKPTALQARKKFLNPEPLVKLSDGSFMPQLAFGMYKVSPHDCENVVLSAINAGYRHFDCASIYGNEEAMGKALIKSGIPREQLYICSKVWNSDQKDGYRGVEASFEKSLRNLRCGYLDLYLVHWPVPGHHITTYKTLEKLVDKGKVRSIGLSNYTPAEYEELIESGIRIHPVVNQIEVSPVMYRPDIITYFHEKDIVVVAFKTLHRGNLTERRTVIEIANAHSKSPAQLFLRWGIQHHLVVISKTSQPKRMKENRDVLDFELSDEEMSLLNILTDDIDVRKRSELEKLRKISM